MKNQRADTKMRRFIMVAVAIGAMALLPIAALSVCAEASDDSQPSVMELGVGAPQPWGAFGTESTVDAGTLSGPRPEPGLSSDLWMDGTWSLLQPQERYGHNAIYDPDGDRILLFGGFDGSSYRNDVWGYSFEGAAWVELPIPQGSRPSPRHYSTAVHDPIRRKMVVFGGYDGSSMRNDTWNLSLQTGTWAHVATRGPTPPTTRYGHSAIYDSQRGRMVIFGGYDGSYKADTWVLSLEDSTWMSLPTSGLPPSGRYLHTAIYDAVRDRMVVFGGYNGSYFGDTWALQFPANVWSQLSTTGCAPGARYVHAAIYDPVHDQMVIVGGWDGSAKKDCYMLPMGTLAWECRAAPPFSGRDAHSLVYDSLRGCMVFFGGGDGTTCRADMWRGAPENPVNWTLVSSAGAPPSGRCASAAVYDSHHDLMVLFGGKDAVPFYNDVWTYRPWGLPCWNQVTTSGTKPPTLGYHSAIYDPLWRRMLVFGGMSSNSGSPRYNDTWELSLQDGPSWGQWSKWLFSASDTLPSPRYGQTTIYHPLGARMVMFGGYDGAYRNDTWVLSLVTRKWQQVFPDVSEGAPTGRYLHTAIYEPSEDRMVVFGGCPNGSSRFNDIWALSFNPLKWRQLTPPGGPAPRYEHTAVYNSVDATMVVFGGYTGSAANDAWKLDLAPGHSVLWAPLSPFGQLPTPRYAHTAIFRPRLGSPPGGSAGGAPGRMIVFGGWCSRGSSGGVDDGTCTLLWLGPRTTVSTPPSVNPARLALNQNWPNPFNPTTTISFDLPVASSVHLEVLNVAGRVVRELLQQDMGPGTHKVLWDGRDGHGMKLASGVYVYRIRAGSASDARKLVLLQ